MPGRISIVPVQWADPDPGPTLDEVENLYIGRVDYISVGRERVYLQLSRENGNRDKVSITLYEDDGTTLLNPREGMWRGAILSVVQRALTHNNRVIIWTV